MPPTDFEAACRSSRWGTPRNGIRRYGAHVQSIPIRFSSLANLTVLAMVLLQLVGHDLPAGEVPRTVAVAGTPYVVPVPALWRVDPDVPGTALVLRGPSSEPAVHQGAIAVVQTPVRAGEDAEAFLTRCETDLSRFAAGFKSGGRGSLAIGGDVWLTLNYSFLIGQETQHQRLHVRIDPERVWVITAGCSSADRLAANGKAIEALLYALGGSRPKLR